jgi:DeoR family fructose operon transcriptional repressor
MSIARREKVLTLLRENGTVMLKELEKLFPEVSSMTLRRDLEYFENLGEAVRIRGGARYIRTMGEQEDVYALRAAKNQDAKNKIARLALKFIEPRRSVYIDAGSTGMFLARSLPDLNFSVVTSGINVAMEISKRYKPSVTMLGGLINRNNLAASGNQSGQIISQLNIDTALIVGSAFSLKNGFTVGNYEEGVLKKSIISKAEKVIMLIDSSKFGKTMPFTFAHMEDIDILITDKRPSEEVMELAQKSQIKVIYE